MESGGGGGILEGDALFLRDLPGWGAGEGAEIPGNLGARRRPGARVDRRGGLEAYTYTHAHIHIHIYLPLSHVHIHIKINKSKDPGNKDRITKALEDIRAGNLMTVEEVIGNGKEKDEETIIDNNKEPGWNLVVGRKAGKKQAKVVVTNKESTNLKPTTRRDPEKKDNPKDRKRSTSRPKLRRLPKTEAITIKCPDGSYEEVMDEAREKIKLEEIGIEDGLKQRTSRSGITSLIISGENREQKAKNLENRLLEIFKEKEGIKVSRPIIKAEMRISGLDRTVGTEDVKAAISKYGDCKREEVTINSIIHGINNIDMVWVRCPAVAANKIIENGKLIVGWARAKATLLDLRPLQCFRCLEGGHVQAECRSKIDRSGRCYRCGEAGHVARSCQGELKCPICCDMGLVANHRVGGKNCTPSRLKSKNINANKNNKETNKENITAIKIQHAIATELKNKTQQKITTERLSSDSCDKESDIVEMEYETQKFARKYEQTMLDEEEEVPTSKRKKAASTPNLMDETSNEMAAKEEAGNELEL